MKLAKAFCFVSRLMQVAYKQVPQLFGQTRLKGMFGLDHSNEQTALAPASNLQCGILIVPKWY